MKPKVGQTWAYSDVRGRQITIKRISRGAVGSWVIESGMLVCTTKRKSCMWVTPSFGNTIALKFFLKDWVFIKP